MKIMSVIGLSIICKSYVLIICRTRQARMREALQRLAAHKSARASPTTLRICAHNSASFPTPNAHNSAQLRPQLCDVRSQALDVLKENYPPIAHKSAQNPSRFIDAPTTLRKMGEVEWLKCIYLVEFTSERPQVAAHNSAQLGSLPPALRSHRFSPGELLHVRAAIASLRPLFCV